MNRISTVVVAAAATAALVLSGCSSEEEPAEASGLRKNTATAQTAPKTESGESATTETTAPGAEGTEVSETTEPDEDSADDTPAANSPSDTTCGQFKELDEPQQQQLIGQILADNPDSAFVGNPNAALGTAKLVCNSEKLADQKVAVVAGIVVNG